MAFDIPRTATITPHLINAAGEQIAVRRHGSGPAVVCLHATGHGGRDFDLLATRLGSEAEFISLDFPGQGDSPAGSMPASAKRYAEITMAAADRLGLDRYVVLGNSIGGAAGIVVAVSRPERVRGLVLCNPGGLTAVNAIVRLYCNMMVKMFRRGERGDARFARDFRRYYQKTVLTTPAAGWRREEIIAAGYKSAPALVQAWESFSRPDADIRAEVPRIQAPVLYAWAKNDKAIAWSRSRKAALTAPKARVEMFNASHAAFLEAPEAFEVSLRRFLKDLPA